jgi:hypothetical protein
VWTRSQVGPTIVLVIKGGRARANNHLSQGIEVELGLKEVKEVTIGKILNCTKQQIEKKEESVLYDFHMDCTFTQQREETMPRSEINI